MAVKGKGVARAIDLRVVGVRPDYPGPVAAGLCPGSMLLLWCCVVVVAVGGVVVYIEDHDVRQ